MRNFLIWLEDYGVGIALWLFLTAAVSFITAKLTMCAVGW